MMTPMLAATIRTDADIPPFPLLATPKIDGVRALIVGGKLVSRALKQIPNSAISSTLESLLPEGADGELFCGSLAATVSTVMSQRAEGSFRFFWFDWAYDASAPYWERAASIESYARFRPSPHVCPLLPQPLSCIGELRAYEELALSEGHEGVVVRSRCGEYKYGRSTLRDGLMAKIKRFADSEAVIVGVHMLLHRAGELSGVPGNTLGALEVQGLDGATFKIGTGFTPELRLALWCSRELLIGKTIKYKYSDMGSRGRPRCPVFMGMRHEDDM